jgi:ABC-2 type transport system permease protein
MKAYIALTRAGIRAILRDRQGLFWSFFFPLFFIVIFGSIFSRGDGKGPDIKFNIALVAPRDLSPDVAWAPDVFRTKVPVFKTHDETLEVAKEKMRKGDYAAVVVFPDDFPQRLRSRQPSNIKVYYDASKPQVGPVVAGVVNNVVGGLDQQMSGAPSLFTAQQEALSPGPDEKKPIRTIDFLLPGILAMTIMQLGLFTAIPIINMREKGILKRFRATPLPRETLVASQVSVRLVVALMQTAIIVLVGALLYKFQVAGSWLVLLALVVTGTLTFICIGAVLSALAKTQESGISMVQLVNFPMMFLSGIFFPVDIMPEGLRPVVDALPATHLADLLRHTMLASPSAYSVATNLGVLGAWFVGSLLLASRVFRWE